MYHPHILIVLVLLLPSGFVIVVVSYQWHCKAKDGAGLSLKAKDGVKN